MKQSESLIHEESCLTWKRPQAALMCLLLQRLSPSASQTSEAVSWFTGNQHVRPGRRGRFQTLSAPTHQETPPFRTGSVKCCRRCLIAEVLARNTRNNDVCTSQDRLSRQASHSDIMRQFLNQESWKLRIRSTCGLFFSPMGLFGFGKWNPNNIN